MTEAHKLLLANIPSALTDTRPLTELTDTELQLAGREFQCLLSLAIEAQQQLTNRRYTLVAAGDQLTARQRDLDMAAHPSFCTDPQQVARDLAVLHGDLQAHLAAWDELAEQQHCIADVTDNAYGRTAEIVAEVRRRDGR